MTVPLFLNPDPAGGGGGTTQGQAQTPQQQAAQAVQQATTQQQTAQPVQQQAAGAAAPQPITLTAEQFQQFQALQGQLDTLRQQEAERQRQAQEKLTQALIDKGQAEQAVKTVRTQLEQERDTERTGRLETEKRIKTYVRDKEVLAAIAAIPNLRPGAAKILTEVAMRQFEAHADGDGFVVRTATFQTPVQYLNDLLKQEGYDALLLPTTQGGATGGGNGNRTTTTPANTDGSPQNLAEAVMANWNEKQKQVRNGAIGLTGKPR